MAKKYGKWKMLRSLSEGGQAHTYLVSLDGSENGEIYVLKRLKNLERIDRFKQEVRACFELAHPNILRIEDHDFENQTPYFVSEYLRGGPLSSLDINSYPLVDRLRLFIQICRAVGHAHQNSPSIVHRDLKPENIFLREDRKTPIVGDFGICFISEEGERFTLVEEAVVARWFSAPELEDGRADEVTPASDVYSLGKLLYWMLAGRVFNREKHRELRFDLTREASNPSMHFIYEILDRTIVLEPSKRMPNAMLVADAVEEVLKKILMNAHPLDLGAPQECLYCGVGSYKKRAETNINDGSAQDTLNGTGLGLRSLQRWLVLVCDNCGNTQIFMRTFPTADKWRT